jgi:hypothetical protein
LIITLLRLRVPRRIVEDRVGSFAADDRSNNVAIKAEVADNNAEIQAGVGSV